MTEVSKLFYIVVVDEDAQGEGVGEEPAPVSWNPNHSFRYTRPVMQSTLQLMGCKTRHAFKQEHARKRANKEEDVLNENDKKPFHFKKRTTVVIRREKFLDVVCDALAEYRYVGPNQRADLVVACRWFILEIPYKECGFCKERPAISDNINVSMHDEHQAQVVFCQASHRVELTEELPVPGSDEEPDEAPVAETEDELSDSGKQEIQEDEMEGSVNEESARSDEGYEDLGTFDEQDGSYWSDNPDGEQSTENLVKYRAENPIWEAVPLDTGKQQNRSHDVDLFCTTSDSDLNSLTCSKPLFTDPTLQYECYSRSLSLTPSRKPRSLTSQFHRVHSRSRSVPAYTEMLNGVIVSGFSSGFSQQ